MLGTMMKGDVTPLLESGQRLFHAYGDDFFQFGQDKIWENFYFLHDQLVAPWAEKCVADLTPQDFSWLEATPKSEVLVLGTGRRTLFPDAKVLDYLSSLNIGYECMDSRSAARTFNLLVGEGRKVAVAMFLPKVRE